MVDGFVGKRILQPKREIMTFLASKGIRVPHIYDSLDEAVKDMQGDNVLLRSEHPQDYEGSSDLFPNGVLDRHLLGSKPITQAIMSQSSQYVRGSIDGIKLHCELLGLDHDEFMKDLSHSAWEIIRGENRVICADPVIEGKYHIFNISSPSYDIVEGSRITQLSDGRLGNPISLKKSQGLIELYEQIRDEMDPDHCYIVETQTVRNSQSSTFDHFAVQTHRGVDNQIVDFKAQPKEWGSLRFHNVRGATPTEEGEDLLLTVKYPKKFREHPEIVVEDASMQTSTHDVASAFSEIMYRRRGLHIFHYAGNQELSYELSFHSSRNSLLKPNCSVLNYGGHLRDKVSHLMHEDKLVQLDVKFVSDGREAYLNFPE